MTLRSPRRLFAVAIAALLAMAAALSLSPGLARADGFYRTTAQPYLYVRNGPSANNPALATKSYNSTIHVWCQTQYGANVNGSTYWDFLGFDSSGRQYWVSDYWTTTPVYNGYSPGLGECNGHLSPFWNY
jgi:hypothetical protein